MKIFKEVVVILFLSSVCGLLFNAFSTNGINILDNPWSRKVVASSNHEKDPISFIGFERACQFIDNQEGIILDARNPQEYAEGHIPGALLLCFYTMKEVYPKLEAQLHAAPALLTYCSDCNCDDSEFLANELLSLGHMPIMVYKGGIEDWKARQMPIARGIKEHILD